MAYGNQVLRKRYYHASIFILVRTDRLTVRRAPLSPNDRGQPVVNVGSNKRPTYLPSHLCIIRPGQVSKLKLEGKQTRGMIKFAVRNPNENAKSITIKGFNTLGFTADNEKLVTPLPFRRCIGSL